MYEKLIEALRDEADEWPQSSTTFEFDDARAMLSRIADQLEAAEAPEFVTTTIGSTDFRSFRPAFPDGSAFKVASLDGESLDVTGSVSKGSTDAEKHSDDDEPLTVEWLEAAQPDGRIWKGCQWFEWTVSPGGCGIFMGCKVRDGLTSRWQLHVRTRGDYRELRRLLGVPLEGG